MAEVIGRFAPTPSGRMHLGNVFAALIAWLSVRSRGGAMVLRMEDLDTQRTSAEYARVLREDLLWLGLDWDVETQPNPNVLRCMTAILIFWSKRACSIPATAPAVSFTASTPPTCPTAPTFIPASAEI